MIGWTAAIVRAGKGGIELLAVSFLANVAEKTVMRRQALGLGTRALLADQGLRTGNLIVTGIAKATWRQLRFHARAVDAD